MYWVIRSSGVTTFRRKIHTPTAATTSISTVARPTAMKMRLDCASAEWTCAFERPTASGVSLSITLRCSR